MQEGVTEQNLRATMAGFYRRADPDGELALVLGAGNVSAIVPLDILDRMINCGEVVICKMNPVNDYLGPIFEDIFASLIRDGYLAFAYGGADAGEYLTGHDAVQAIHITGSARTFDLIVYGPGEEGQRRKAAGDRVWANRSTPNSAASARRSSCQARGPRPTSGTRPTTWSRRNCTMPGTTASPARSLSSPRTGTAAQHCCARSGGAWTPPSRGSPTTPAPRST